MYESFSIDHDRALGILLLITKYVSCHHLFNLKILESEEFKGKNMLHVL